jgi:hypothetical protein
MTRPQTNSWVAKRLIGRRIVRVKLNSFRDGRSGWVADPTLFLDDGTALRFIVKETELGADYGIELVLRKGANEQ